MGWSFFLSRNDHDVVVKLFVAPNLLVGQRKKVLCARSGDEEGPAQDVIRDSASVAQRSVVRQIQIFSFGVANNRNRIGEGIDSFNVPANDFLHIVQTTDLPHLAGLHRLHHQNLDRLTVCVVFPGRQFCRPLKFVRLVAINVKVVISLPGEKPQIVTVFLRVHPEAVVVCAGGRTHPGLGMAPAVPFHAAEVFEGTVLPQGIDYGVQLIFELLALQLLVVVPPCGPELRAAAEIAPQVANASLIFRIAGEEQEFFIPVGFLERIPIIAHGISLPSFSGASGAFPAWAGGFVLPPSARSFSQSLERPDNGVSAPGHL